jgi:hypothetical protein
MSTRPAVRLTLATAVAALALCAGRAPQGARADVEPAPAGDPRVAAALDAARQAAGELTETIRGLLQQELQRGGYDGAVRVCSEAAQRLTREYRETSGRDVRRVSLKPRNPADAPDAFERGVLEEFERQRATGGLPGERFEVRREAGRETLRYLRPLVTSALCLNCHGRPDDIPPAVSAILKEKYPDDPATGYQAGDVRGAVSVAIELPAAAR